MDSEKYKMDLEKQVPVVRKKRPKVTFQSCLFMIGSMLGFQVAFFAGMQFTAIHHDECSGCQDGGLKSLCVRPVGQEQKSYQLALQESFGFFDDIDDETWKKHKERAQNAPDHKFPLDPLKFFHSPAGWYVNNYEPVFTCPNVRRVGGAGDGPKWTCDPHRLMTLARRRKQEAISKKSNHPGEKYCLIYSFGSAGKFEWEDGLLELLGNQTCEIHVFDPGKAGMKGATERGLHYHKWGMRSSYDKHYKPLTRGEFFTFQQTLEKLGHTNRTIDILKIDCEMCEWFCYKDFLTAADVRQITVETHNLPWPQKDTSEGQLNWPYPPMKATDYFDAFKENNFYLYSKEINAHPYAGGNGAEWSYVRLHENFRMP